MISPLAIMYEHTHNAMSEIVRCWRFTPWQHDPATYHGALLSRLDPGIICTRMWVRALVRPMATNPHDHVEVEINNVAFDPSFWSTR